MLYELSLAVGRSLDFDDACSSFLTLLVARKDLSYAGVWIASRELPDGGDDDDTMTLVCALPRARARHRRLQASHPAFAAIGAGGVRNLRADDPGFAHVCDESGVAGGGYALFDLDGIGILKLYTNRNGGFHDHELNQLHAVMDKFAISLRGALSHRRMLAESRAREAAQRSRIEQASLLRSVVDSVPDMLFYKDLDGVYLGCNRVFERYVNRSEKEIVGATDFDLVDRDTAKFFRRMDAAAIATGQARRNEEWITYPDGQRVLLETVKTPILSLTGDVIGLIGVGRDITGRDRTDELIRRRLKLENAISTVSSKFVGRIDIDRCIDESLQELAEMSEADRVYLMALDELSQTMSCRREWCRDRVPPMRESFQAIPIRALSCLIDRLTAKERFVIPDVASYQTATPAGRELLLQRGSTSIIAIPVRIEGRLEGFIGFDYQDRSHARTPEDLAMMQVASEIVGRALERRRAEDFLRRYEYVVGVAQDMISLVDRDYRYLLVNDACERAHGISAEEICGTTVAEFVGEETFHAEVKDKLDRCLGGETVRHQHWLALPGAGMRYLDVLYSPYRGDHGDTVEGAVLSVRDFTEQKKWEDALEQSEAKIRSIVRAAPVGIGIVADRRFVEVNDRFCSMTGYDRAELVGHSTRMMYLSDKDWSDARQEKLRQMQEDEIGTVEATVVRKDGTLATMLLSSTPINPRDYSEGFTFTALDITDRRQTEDALRRSQKMDAIGQMAGGIAHDFNNVLGIVLGNLNLLRRALRNQPSMLRRIESIEKSALRAADLTNHLLTFSRRDPSNLSQVNANDVVAGMHNLLTRSVTPEIVVRTRFEAALWVTSVDRGDLEDSLLNLVLNARDAMPRGGTLSIATANRCVTGDTPAVDLQPGDYVVISVSDTGVGIPRQNLEHIFEPFFTTKSEGHGTGLGLSMVFGFVKRSRGHIEVESEPGNGTTFRIYLPRTVATVDAGAAEDRQTGGLQGGTETILVVDDEADLVELTAEVLESLGYRVLTAPSGRAAVEVLRDRDDIDLVFSDIVMPGGVNGYDLARHLREHYPHIRVLLTSGYTGKSGYVETGDEDFGELLKKPYTEVDLAERIRETLDAAPGASATDAADADADTGIETGPPIEVPTIGIAGIDESHEAIVALVVRANRVLSRGVAGEQVGAILVELEDHVTAHFEEEEAVMKEHRCPELAQHAAEHRRLYLQVAELRHRLEHDRLAPEALTSFLHRELVPHIAGFDARLGECVPGAATSDRRPLVVQDETA